MIIIKCQPDLGNNDEENHAGSKKPSGFKNLSACSDDFDTMSAGQQDWKENRWQKVYQHLWINEQSFPKVGTPMMELEASAQVHPQIKSQHSGDHPKCVLSPDTTWIRFFK